MGKCIIWTMFQTTTNNSTVKKKQKNNNNILKTTIALNQIHHLLEGEQNIQNVSVARENKFLTRTVAVTKHFTEIVK